MLLREANMGELFGCEMFAGRIVRVRNVQFIGQNVSMRNTVLIG